MVFTSATLVAVVSACVHLTTTHAAPLESNAYTSTANVILLNAENPAYGGISSKFMPEVIVPQEENLPRAEVVESVLPSNTTTRHLEGSTNPDLAKLEAYFGAGKIDRNFDKLKSYSSKSIEPSPWPSNYWPTWSDSINIPWDGPGTMSASEKYARAFGLNVKTFMDGISTSNGVDSMVKNRPCRTDSDCTSLNNGSHCGKRVGQDSGYCIPSWIGICHAWSPAAILEKEPTCDVTVNGVVFKPLDIKALLSLLYDGVNLPTVFTGAREDGQDKFDNGQNVDQYGRYKDAAARDLGAGYFHIAVSNIMGKFGQSFVLDIDPGYKVWNQPVRSFNVKHTELLTPDEAAQRFFNVTKYPFNDAAKQIAYVEMDLAWINEMWVDVLPGDNGPWVSTGKVDTVTGRFTHKYVLELDDNNNILGGEWVADSKIINHPDFLWFATSKPDANAVSKVGLSYKLLQDLLTASTTGCPATPEPTPAPSGGRCGNEQSGAAMCPAGEYCQPWNPTDYFCRKMDAKCGKPEVGKDYWGNDLETVSGLLLPEQCCDKCHATAGCTSYTFINYVTWGDGKPLCFLKSGTPSDKRGNPKAVSAMIVRDDSNTNVPSCDNKLWGRCGSAAEGAKCCETGAYCQPWDLNNYQCMPLPKKCSKQFSAIDFWGEDLSVSYGLDTEGCCNLCASTTGCKAFTYINDNPGKPACYLKKGSSDRRPNAHAVSGLVN